MLMRFLKKYWPLAPVVIVFAIAIYAIASPAPEQQCTDHYAAAHGETRSQCLEILSAETVANWTKVLGALTLVLAAASAIEIFYLIQAADIAGEQKTMLGQQAKLLADQVRASKAELRAYALRQGVDVEDVMPGKSPVATVKVVNFGKTPAFKFYLAIENLTLIRYVNNNTLIPADRSKPHDGSHEVLGPGDSRSAIYGYVDSNNTPLILSTSDVARLGTGEPALFLYGAIFYEDSFGCEHRSTIRVFVGGPTKLALLPRMAPDVAGNEAD